ncbi:MAG: NADH-quinone oxidoreductase subunit NuoH [Chloroflexi bacterium]|nr:NADH-quinone oxidoreductase subunit NuoH [Chloroflexota bacterium]
MIEFLIEAVIKSAIIVLVLLTSFAYITWLERKVLARMQARIGPNRAAPFGLLLPLADGIKLIFKEDTTPLEADKFVYLLAPILAAVPAFIIFAVIPIGDTITLFGRTITLYLTDLNVGLLFIFSITSIGVYGIALAGWSSSNKYALLGGLRATAQMISYELPFSLSVVGVLMMVGSFSLVDIVKAQNSIWFVILQPVAFVIFMICAAAEVNRSPFDLPEAEQELTAGYHTEYSGMKFALFYAAEYIKIVAMSALAVVLFFGGWQGPPIPLIGSIPIIWFVIKVFIFLFAFIWVRATLPRFRYDQLMSLGWKVLLPLALANVVITAIAIVLRDLR